MSGEENMKGKERKQRFGLTLLFSGVVFCAMLLTLLVVGAFIFAAERAGWFYNRLGATRPIPFFVFIALSSLVVGAVLTTLVVKIPLKPINSMINAMDRLASGDFKTRLKFGTIFAKHPTVIELTESFNTMAEELENTEMLRSDFINNFSHEFKTPIVSIAGFAKLLKRGNLTEQEKKEYLDIIEEESLRLSYMATNVLNMTKVENQTILTDVTRFNLSEQLRNCVLLLENKWTKKKLELNLEFDEYIIDANEELLKQVWVNLIDNAVKFSPEGGTVEIEIRESGGDISVTVANTGSGIKAENIERIFHKFYQEDVSHAAEGNGIGLAIVKRVVELHGGTARAESLNNRTAFCVTLPKAGAAAK
jgi:signal transduction histidine kinase